MPTWHTNLWQFCTESRVRLRETKPWLYNPPHINDFHLMDVVLSSNIHQEYKEIFNRIRMNLRLMTASDIVLADRSMKIRPDIMPRKNIWDSDLNWPNIVEVPKGWYGIFRMVIKQIIEPQLQSTPLGDWIAPGHQSFRWCITNQHKSVRMDNDKLASNDTTIPVYVSYVTNKILGKQILKPNQSEVNDNNVFTAIETSPRWMKKLWRGNKFDKEVTKKDNWIFRK